MGHILHITVLLCTYSLVIPNVLGLDRRFCKNKRSGYYPDPKDCRNFYQCNGGTTYFKPCPDGLLFTPGAKVCDWASNVKCGTGTDGGSQTTTRTTTTPPPTTRTTTTPPPPTTTTTPPPTTTTTRVIEEGNYLVYAQGNKIMRISANEYSNENGQILAYEPGMLAVGVEIDCQEGDIYWTDAAHGVIKRAKSNGSNIETLVNGMKSPEGIAIDFVARNMFFIDSEMDSLHVAKLNGSDVKTLVNTDMFNPRAIALDVSRGVVYWTDWNRNYPQIERINMDGTEREVLVADNLSLPNGLAFDPYSQTLCWGDAGTQKIECMREDGAGRRVVYGQASYPFDLTLLNNVIYWTDWRMREIPFVNQNGGEMNKGLKPAMGGHGRAYGITALRDRCPRARNSCGLNNGGCKYLCLPTASGGRTCACPDGMDPRACEN